MQNPLGLQQLLELQGQQALEEVDPLARVSQATRKDPLRLGRRSQHLQQQRVAAQLENCRRIPLLAHKDSATTRFYVSAQRIHIQVDILAFNDLYERLVWTVREYYSRY